jgi:hypothetical protein
MKIDEMQKPWLTRGGSDTKIEFENINLCFSVLLRAEITIYIYMCVCVRARALAVTRRRLNCQHSWLN